MTLVDIEVFRRERCLRPAANLKELMAAIQESRQRKPGSTPATRAVPTIQAPRRKSRYMEGYGSRPFDKLEPSPAGRLRAVLHGVTHDRSKKDGVTVELGAFTGALLGP
jgi:hypothetical protein